MWQYAGTSKRSATLKNHVDGLDLILESGIKNLLKYLYPVIICFTLCFYASKVIAPGIKCSITEFRISHDSNQNYSKL